VGLANGVIIAYIGISPILATLGTMTLLEGISLVITRGYVISGLPRSLLVIGNGTFLGVPVPLFILIAVAIAVAILLNKTRLGLSTYMIGSNIKATGFSGINTNKVTILVYMISGLLAGIASLIMMARFNSAKAGYGSSYLLVTVLVSVLGGINPNGGFGKVSGVFIGLILLQVISSGLNLLGISQFLTLALWGALLLGVEARYCKEKSRWRGILEMLDGFKEGRQKAEHPEHSCRERIGQHSGTRKTPGCFSGYAQEGLEGSAEIGSCDQRVWSSKGGQSGNRSQQLLPEKAQGRERIKGVNCSKAMNMLKNDVSSLMKAPPAMFLR
jgi:hypothetical protein